MFQVTCLSLLIPSTYLKVRHILDHGQSRHTQRREHFDTFTSVGGRQFGWRCYSNRSTQLQLLEHSQLDITRPWRQVKNQYIQITPVCTF